MHLHWCDRKIFPSESPKQHEFGHEDMPADLRKQDKDKEQEIGLCSASCTCRGSVSNPPPHVHTPVFPQHQCASIKHCSTPPPCSELSPKALTQKHIQCYHLTSGRNSSGLTGLLLNFSLLFTYRHCIFHV